MTRFELLINRKRNQYIKKGRVIFANAIKEQIKQSLVLIRNSDPSKVSDEIRAAVTIDPIRKAFEKYYSMSADFAMMWRTKLITQKAENDPYLTIFQRDMIRFAQTKGRKRMEDVTKTTENYLINSVERATIQATEEGLGVQATRDLIISYVQDMEQSITQVRANLIAQTEMITASNAAAVEAGKSTGLETKKFWSTSGLPNTRESHLQAEADSIANNGYADGELFSNGLEYPGDPNGSAEEVCNCRCRVIIDIA